MFTNTGSEHAPEREMCAGGPKKMSSILADQIAPSYVSPNAGGGGGGGGCRVSTDEYSCAHEAKINFGDLTPYVTYGSAGRWTGRYLCLCWLERACRGGGTMLCMW
jgi:hypothetical protein